jgi:hypothetical protein
MHPTVREDSTQFSASERNPWTDLMMSPGDSVRCKQSNLSRGGVVKHGAKDSTT